MEQLNLTAAWIGILVGMIWGAVVGLCFHRQEWLGGYGSWRRRLLRLGHVSFFGLAFINLAFVVTVSQLEPSRFLDWSSRLFVAGAITMPVVCFLSAFQPVFRFFFFVPVASVLAGSALVLYPGVSP